MRISFVDVLPAAVDQTAIGTLPASIPSTALLARAAIARDEGHEVTWQAIWDGTASSDRDIARDVDRVVVAMRPWNPAPATKLAAELRERGVVVEQWNAWETPLECLPAYALATGVSGVSAFAEVDVAPYPDPVHPWISPSTSTMSEDASEEQREARLEAAALTLAGSREAALYLADERIALDLPRIRSLARLVRTSLERGCLLTLHVRVWPGDLLREGVLEHLSLLPVGSLDILAGSFRNASLARMASTLDETGVRSALEAVRQSGMSHLSRLSLALGLPGESVDDAIETLRETFGAAVRHRIPRVRLALWTGGVPTTPAETRARFLASHPQWNAVELDGLSDYTAISAHATGVNVIGPS